MLKLSDPTQLRKRIAGLSLIGFPLAGLIAAFVDANEGTGTAPADLYAIAAAHSDAILVAALVFMVSAILTVPAAMALVHLVRGRGVALAHIGGVMLVLGAFGHMGYATWQLVLSRIPQAGDQVALIAFLDRQQAVINAVLLPLLVSIALGILFLVIALRRAGFVARWFAFATYVLLGYDVVLNSTALGEDKLPVIFVWVGITALFGLLGVRVLRMSRGEWTTPSAAPESRSPRAADPATA